jgi:hypothetical protein
MTRRFCLRCLAWSLGWLGWQWTLANSCQADEKQATLNEQLRSILKCRRPEEFAYVNLVTSKVDSGELPRAMVLSMMQWARKRARQDVESPGYKSDIPFPYFQEGLHRRAAEIGVSLPAFTVNTTQ